MPPNSVRFDLSDYLIHFFREVDQDHDNCPILPEDWGADCLVEDTRLSPFFLMRCAVRHRRLWATWSFRDGRRLIYGPHAAICFTEMPLAAFLESSAQRAAAGEAMSQYALIFRKDAMFALGARPVIYALDNTPHLPSGAGGGPRLIDAAILPLQEQFRYVTYVPRASERIDWTHEREWRWPFRAEMPNFNEELWPASPRDIPGLEIASPNCRGLGAIVKSQNQADRLAGDILTLIDRGLIDRDHFGYILVLENLPPLQELRNPLAVDAAMMNGLLTLDQYFQATLQASEALAERVGTLVAAIEESAPEPEAGEVGGCWLCLNDNRHPLTRALVAVDQITVTESGRYLYFPYYDDSRSVQQRQELTLRLAAQIREEFGLNCTYYSVIGSDDVDGVPYFTGDIFAERPSYNYAHIREDF